LKSSPGIINLKFLRTLPAYKEAQAAWKNKSVDTEISSEGENEIETPEELMENGYQKIRKSLE
jgi:restriction endonuclease Mrr